ncbi:hypothetical protein ACWXV6_14925 [Pantoea ananatis]|uniref:hypothetical protein n=1 Tax=Pantoea ananas TaxID=553 RepID=UPI00105993C7|nr:hypothetical protein [Pantoea ananatis]TDL54708.1 hypothetical protein E2R52_12045 [Pantoea ananatis]
MAKTDNSKTEDDLGGLPPELMTGDQTTTVTPPGADVQKSPEVTGEDSDAEEDDDKDGADEEEPDFVVRKGHTLRHDGKTYRQNTRLNLPADEAKRLIAAGVVVDFDTLRREAQAREAASVSVSSPGLTS